jgi:phage recombination protein Bet
MATGIVPRQVTIPKVAEKTIKDFLFSTKTRLTEEQQTLFITIAKEFNLNPFKREIHAVGFGNSFTCVTGYQVYIARAEATGLLDGWECSLIKEGDKILGAEITIYRKDWTHPFSWKISFTDFVKQQANWKTMPGFMIKKVAIGQGFRFAFPNELGNMPYLQEELSEFDPINGNGKPDKPEKKKPVKKKSDGDAYLRMIEKAQSMTALISAWNIVQQDKEKITAKLLKELTAKKDMKKNKIITELLKTKFDNETDYFEAVEVLEVIRDEKDWKKLLSLNTKWFEDNEDSPQIREQVERINKIILK